MAALSSRASVPFAPKLTTDSVAGATGPAAAPVNGLAVITITADKNTRITSFLNNFTFILQSISFIFELQ
ncbi:hypothetical protein [Paenibacillus psychroresistens]|uniref:hypothetical protein n=1 Tax=Paenibacillus psychroresistens TaxID=1778678 RepID=UPI001D05326F|nr:hypothetical protein [Paenibacillus psychroresistens]